MEAARRRRRTTAALVVLAALIATVVWWVLRTEEPGPSAPRTASQTVATPRPDTRAARPSAPPTPRAGRAEHPADGDAPAAALRSVRVIVYEQRPDPGESVVLPGALLFLRDPAGRERRATTDATGNARFDDVPAGDFAVRAEAEGHVDSEWSAARDVELEVVILERATALEGRVIDGDGHAVEGADVAVASGRPMHMGGEALYFAPLRLEDGIVHRRVRTGADGRFRADRLPPARPVLVRAGKPPLGPADVEAMTRRLDATDPADDVVIVIEPCGALTGTVSTSDGKPVPGAAVWAAEETDPALVADLAAGSAPQGFRRAGALGAVCNADGTFRLEGLRRGRNYAAVAQADRFAPSETTGAIRVTDAAPVARRDLVVRRKAIVVVRVVGPDGKPPEDTYASCETSTAGSSLPGTGVHECWHVVPGRRGVAAQAKGCPRETTTVDVPDGGRVEVTIRLSRGIAWSVVVVDPDGKPLAGKHVRAWHGEDSWGQATTDSEGRATFDGLRPDPHVVEAWGEGFARKRIDAEVAAGAPALRIAMSRGGLLRGVVKRRDGFPGMFCVEVKGPVEETAYTGDDGRFEVRLPPGHYDVKAFGGETSKGAEVEDGGTTDVEVLLP